MTTDNNPSSPAQTSDSLSIAVFTLSLWAVILVFATLSHRPPGVGAIASPREVAAKTASVAPQTPWLRPADDAVLTRIGVGSCLSQAHPQPIWDGVLSLDRLPQLFLMIGDNVYGDIKSSDGRELIEAYRLQAAQPDLAKVRAKIPFLATWDDHDYGANDAGAAFPHKALAARLFYDFWQKEPLRGLDEGIYHARIFGPEGRRVQIILLDTRTFRSQLKRKGDDFPFWGRYEPVEDASRTMLGDAQWAWLGEQLRKPAALRIVVTSVQFIAEGHGFERWGNLPLEQRRFFDLVAETGAKGIVILSGDRHFGALYDTEPTGGPRIVEMTASSLNRSYGPAKDGPSPGRIGRMFNEENFGLVDIDWQERRLTLSLRGMRGEVLNQLRVSFSDLDIKGAAP